MGLPLAKELQASGKYDVTTLTAIPWYPAGRRYPGYKLRPWQWETLAGIRILRVPLWPSHDSSLIKRILTYGSFALSAITLGIPNIGPVDVVYYFDSLPTTGLVAWALATRRGAATVQHIGDLWPDTALESGMLPRPLSAAVRTLIGRWCKFLYRRHSAITVASPGLGRLLAKRGVPPDKISVVHTWAFENTFFPAPPDPNAIREMQSEGRFTVLYAGNLGPLQALNTLIDAAALLRDKTGIQFVVIGTGQAEQALKTRASDLNLANVRFLPAQPLSRMNAFNASADALLVHLRDIGLMRATTPSKTQVAMACGKPILMGVAGDAAELVESAGAGLTFAPENPRAMADAVLQMYEMPADERRTMGANGRRFYETRMALRVGAERLSALIARAGENADRLRLDSAK